MLKMLFLTIKLTNCKQSKGKRHENVTEQRAKANAGRKDINQTVMPALG